MDAEGGGNTRGNEATDNTADALPNRKRHGSYQPRISKKVKADMMSATRVMIVTVITVVMPVITVVITVTVTMIVKVTVTARAI